MLCRTSIFQPCVLSEYFGLDAISMLVMEAPIDWMIRAEVRRESLTQNTIMLSSHVYVHSFCFSTGITLCMNVC